MEFPDVQYARSGDVAIAYQTFGEGPVDLVFVRGFAGDLLSVWEQPLLVRFAEELASFTRLTMIDKRGEKLLRAMWRAGAELIARGVYLRYLVADINSRCRRFRRSAIAPRGMHGRSSRSTDRACR